ncbi:helix-turn-helix transcriptional regulator [Pseudogemmobacter sp. W21_MBD1_M6]|uniref:helix-turn-helix transcriptional regulator n=1 Tax=Pseudogemmobacter sp. W21_MBD1_M6 TaxID=3240271 RepID=UPI003F9DEDCE
MENFSTGGNCDGMKNIANNMIPRESRKDRVALRVHAIREALKLTKAEFADAIALDRSSLTKIEKGEAGLDIAVAERIYHIYGFGLNFIYANDLTDVPRELHSDLIAILMSENNRN